MPHVYEPHLEPVEISSLRPTQMTVGFREVAAKRLEWRAIRAEKGNDFLGHHMVPVVLGPKGRSYLVDHHHLVRALYEEDVERVLTSLVADFSHLERDEFWAVMDHRSFIYPFDTAGIRHAADDLPKKIADLDDDPFRSLAGAVRSAGGFAKIEAPFSEFLWADFLRRRMDRKSLANDFDRCVAEALQLARSREARHLPGWSGIEH